MLSERQEAILLERLPRDWTEEDIANTLRGAGVDLGDAWHNSVLLMRSRLGLSIGRAVVAVTSHVPHVKMALPEGTTYRPMDRHDVESFIEQCERFVNLSDDLRRLARPENFLRVITITEVPSTYGRKDIVHVIRERCAVEVCPQDVVFRFKRWGRQSDTCYVLCPPQRMRTIVWHRFRNWPFQNGQLTDHCLVPLFSGLAAQASSCAIQI